MAEAMARPALCEDCEEAPARRLFETRWVCERCCTEAALEAERARRGPAPPAERREPDEKMWHVGTYSGVFRCVQTNQRGTQLLECGQRHRTRDDAAAHAARLNEAMSNYTPVQTRCARHKELRNPYAAERYLRADGRLCPVCEADRYVRSLLQALPEAGAEQWSQLNEWEQTFVTDIRGDIASGKVLTERQLATVEKLYRQVWDEPEPV